MRHMEIRLRPLLQARGMTQKELAEMTELRPSRKLSCKKGEIHHAKLGTQ